ncbi:hypothetical protein [Amycolatopsis sp. cmx-4-61]|uniref:hypothetical protein n=1 Tax=Amycolatopsis sp. cmx-4-61 TaxID=2790937 RepID=UPI00397B6881
MTGRLRRIALLVIALAAAVAVPADAGAAVTVGAPVVGRSGVYDYSPSVIQSGNVQKFWWCGKGQNPQNPSQNSDTIQYESIDLSTGAKDGPRTVLAETPGAWDSLYTCNAAVVQGTFRNPLGDGIAYSYAMYYVGTNTPPGINNHVGVAFSTDGTTWKKYPNPIVSPTGDGGYGIAEPAPYNSDGGSGIWLFYENEAGHYLVKSTDGVHFAAAAQLSANGLPPNSTWGDIAYDRTANQWYAVYNKPVRTPATTGGVVERGQYGYTLYRIGNAALFTGTWQELTTVDTNLTGYESNFIPGLLRDPNGTVNVPAYPQIEVYASTSVPRPAADASPAQAATGADTSKWDIVWSLWTASPTTRPLVRYYSTGLKVHEVTTGWVDTGSFHVESTLGRLVEAPTATATKPLYGCKNGTKDYFVSPESGCENTLVLGLQGYAYPQQTTTGQVPLYRCYTGNHHFVTTQADCEGQRYESLLGYADPP